MMRLAYVVCLAMLLVAASSGLTETQPSSPAPTATTKGAMDAGADWTLYATGTEISDGNRTKTVFIVTLVNTGKTDQTVYMPGFQPPILLPTDPQAEPLSAFHMPRQATGGDKHLDYIVLNPEEGVSRTFEIAAAEREITSLAAVTTNYLIYETHEGAGFLNKVRKVIKCQHPYVLKKNSTRPASVFPTSVTNPTSRPA